MIAWKKRGRSGHAPFYLGVLCALLLLSGLMIGDTAYSNETDLPQQTNSYDDFYQVNSNNNTARHINPDNKQNSPKTNSKFKYLELTNDEQSQRINALPYLSYLIDGSFKADIQDIRAIPSDKWKLNETQTQNFGQLNAPIWFKLKIKQPALENNNTQRYLKLRYPHHDNINIFFMYKNQTIEEINTGDLLPFNTRATELPIFAFKIPKQPQTLDIYLSVQSEGILQLPLSIVTQAELRKQASEFSFLSGIYFGSILIMLIYNGFIYLTVKDKSYLYYLIYLCSCATLQLVLSGIGFQYIWPNLPELNNYAVILSATFVGISAIIFIQNFIGINHTTAKRDDILIKLLIISFMLISISSFTISYSFALSMTFINVSLLVITGFYLGVKYWLKGVKTARFFALAWFSYLLFVIIYLLETNRYLTPNIINENAISIGSLIELALLSIAFADKLNVEKNLRVQAQDALLDVQIQMNADLDNIVNARTSELESANTQLKELSVTDSLTKLKNRYYFDQTFKREFKRAARENWNFSVMMIDVDHFKKINDQYGHLFGDYCLSKSAQLIQSVIHRPSDTVARYGGEEIAIILPNTPLDGAVQLAEKIREQFKETEFDDSDIQTYMTVSIGVASATPDRNSLRNAIKLLDLADQCLYKAKQTGRDKVIGQKHYFN